jgi:hypothetical protein
MQKWSAAFCRHDQCFCRSLPFLSVLPGFWQLHDEVGGFLESNERPAARQRDRVLKMPFPGHGKTLSKPIWKYRSSHEQGARQQLGVDMANNFMLMTLFSLLADMADDADLFRSNVKEALFDLTENYKLPGVAPRPHG